MKGLIRGTVQHSLAWSFSAVFTVLIVVVMLLTAGKFPERITLPMIRFWGRTMLKISGVKLEFEGDCSALHQRAPRVFTFNHASTLDVFIITAIISPGGTAVVKRSIVYIPFIGWSAYLVGLVLLDRGNRDRATASLNKAGQRIRDEQLSVFIAPEGTRTSSRVPSPFKMGAFRMAEVAGADIVPVVIDGAAEAWSRDKLYSTGGTVKIRLLAPIPHADLLERGAKVVAEDLRHRYAKDLGVALSAA
ncbi:MAG: lysophospholipid acyltransferase family protein [bacterium]